MRREVCFAPLQQPFARFQLERTLSDGVARAVAQTLASRRFCGLRSFASGIFSAFVRTSNGSRNGTNRKRLAILAVTVFRGRALSLSVAVNRMHMVPLPFATGNNAETRDRELKARWAGYSPMKSRIRRVRAGWLYKLRATSPATPSDSADNNRMRARKLPRKRGANLPAHSSPPAKPSLC